MQIRPNEVMEHGARVHVPVSIAETRISKRYDAIPCGTLYPNADEIKYLQRLVIYKVYPFVQYQIYFISYSFLLLFLLFNSIKINFIYCVIKCFTFRTQLLLCLINLQSCRLRFKFLFFHIYSNSL